MDLTLGDLFGKLEEIGAEEMIKEVDAKLVKGIHERISKYKKEFNALTKQEQKQKIIYGTDIATKNMKSGIKSESCICCGSKGLVAGKLISVSEEKLEDSEIVYERIILPTSYNCYSCGFKLNGHQELTTAGYGGQFTEKVIWDPAEYYEIETKEPDISDFYDYGND